MDQKVQKRSIFREPRLALRDSPFGREKTPVRGLRPEYTREGKTLFQSAFRLANTKLFFFSFFFLFFVIYT